MSKKESNPKPIGIKRPPAPPAPPRPVGAMTTATLKNKVSKSNKIRKVIRRYLDETEDPTLADFFEWLDCIK